MKQGVIRNHRCRIESKLVEAVHKGQLKGEDKAIRVPRGRNDKSSPQAFSSCTEIRHALVEGGVKFVRHLPGTVVSLLHGAFSWCQILRVVVAPGCKHFGTKVFEECRSLTRVGTAQCPSNRLAPQAQLRPRAFQACTALSHIKLGTPEPDAARPNRCLPNCCFLEAGIVALALPTDFNRIDSAACASCQQLQTVELSPADVLEISGSAVAHCSQVQQLCLSRNLKNHRSKKPSSSVPLYRKFPLHHPCFTLRDALLQVARNFEQYASKEKVKHCEGHMPDPMPLTNVSNSISPNGSDFCRPMPMIYGEKTF